MSTVKVNINQNRFARLAKLGEVVFHIDDLANLWQITNKNTLHTTLKRYVKQGLLVRIYRGFYSLKPVGEINPFFLGVKAIHQFGYISAETVLERAGIIQQKTNYITLVSSKSKRFSIGDYNYYCRQLNGIFLFQDAGVKEQNGFKIATVERAVADLLYFNPTAYFDNSKLINWEEVRNIQKTVGYPLTPQRYDDIAE